MTTREVKGTFYGADDTPAEGLAVTFRLSPNFRTDAGHWLTGMLTETTNGQGEVIIDLVCGARYSVRAVGQKEFAILIPDEAGGQLSLESLHTTLETPLTDAVQDAIQAALDAVLGDYATDAELAVVATALVTEAATRLAADTMLISLTDSLDQGLTDETSARLLADTSEQAARIAADATLTTAVNARLTQAAADALYAALVHTHTNLTQTTSNTYSIGDGLDTLKTLRFVADFVTSLTANPTAARTIALPDLSGTVALLSVLQSGSMLLRSAASGYALRQYRNDSVNLFNLNDEGQLDGGVRGYVNLIDNLQLGAGKYLNLGAGAMVGYGSGNQAHWTNGAIFNGTSWSRAFTNYLPQLKWVSASALASIALALTESDTGTPVFHDLFTVEMTPSSVKLTIKLATSGPVYDRQAAQIEFSWSDATDATRDGQIKFSIVKDGTLIEVARLDSAADATNTALKLYHAGSLKQVIADGSGFLKVA